MKNLTLRQIGEFLVRALVAIVCILIIVSFMVITQDFWLPQVFAWIDSLQRRWSDWGDAQWFLKEVAIWFSQGPRILTAPGPFTQNLLFFSMGMAIALFFTREYKKRVKVLALLWPAVMIFIIAALYQYPQPGSTHFGQILVLGMISWVVGIYFVFKR